MKWCVAGIVILSFSKPLRKKLTHFVCKLLRPGHNPWGAKEELEKNHCSWLVSSLQSPKKEVTEKHLYTSVMTALLKMKISSWPLV